MADSLRFNSALHAVKRNLPTLFLFIGLLVPTFQLGVGYFRGLVVLVSVSLVILLVLRVIGLRGHYFGGFLVAIAVAVVFLASLAVLNATFLTVPIVALLLFGALVAFKAKGRNFSDCKFRVNFTNLSWGIRSSYVAIAVLSLLAWQQISNGIMSGGRLDSDKLFADVPLLTGLVRSIMDGEGLSAPFLYGFELQYHWMSYGFSAWFADVSGLDQILVTFGVVPFLFFFLTLCLASTLAASISKSKWAPLLASVSLALVGAVGVWRFAQISIWDWGSPSTVVSTFLGLAVTFVILVRVSTNIYLQTFLAFILSLGAGLSKISMGVVLALTAFFILSIALFTSRFRMQRAYVPLLAIILGAGIAGLSTFTETGGELTTNPILGVVSKGDLIQIAETAISETSFIFASVFLWAGIGLMFTTRKWRETPYIWAMVAGVVGQFIYFLLVSPDANDRFFAVSGLAIAIPILATLIPEIRFRVSGLPAWRSLLLAFLVMGSIISMGKAAWSNTFDSSPYLFAVLLFVTTLLFVLLAHGSVDMTGRLSAYVTLGALFLMLMSVSAPQMLKFFDDDHVSTSSGISISQILSPQIERTGANVWRIQFKDINKRLLEDRPIAIWRSNSVPGIIGRWASYDLKPIDYVTSETDIEGLVSPAAQSAADERRSLVSEALTGSRSARNLLCKDGLEQIVSLGVRANSEDVNNISRVDGLEIGVFELNCK